MSKPVLHLMDRLIDYEMGNLNDAQILKLFRDLIALGLVWRLPGHYGRVARRLLDAGLIRRDSRGCYVVSVQ